MPERMTAQLPYVAIVDDDASVRTALSRLLTASAFRPQTYPCAVAFLRSLADICPEGLNIPARAKAANAIGVRTANVITHAPYHGVQLHPRDCRAAFIEFNHTDGSDDMLGAYPPAGPDWQKCIRNDVTQALTGVVMQGPDPAGLAAHWGRILGIPVSRGEGGAAELKLPNAVFRFVEGESEIMSA